MKKGDIYMNYQTKHKKLKENLFADIVFIVGAYMEYVSTYPVFIKKDFIKFCDKRNKNICERCKTQNRVIKQAKFYYEEKGKNIDITYNKVKRIYRKNINCNYRIRREQYYFWKFVMDFLVDNKMILDFFFEEVMVECKYYEATKKSINPYIDCLQNILDWYYVRIEMNNGIFYFGRGLREKMVNMFENYEKLTEFKNNCNEYMMNKEI